MIARRTRLAFLNSEAAESSLDRIVQIMAENLDWSKKRIQVSGGLDVPGYMLEVGVCAADYGSEPRLVEEENPV